MGYDLADGPDLNFGKGRRTLLWSFVPKGKTPDYYHRTRRGLGYVSTPISSPLSLKSRYITTARQTHHHGSQMSVSVTSSKKTFSKHGFNEPPGRWRWRNNLIRYRSLNQTPNALWDIRFEQREPPIDDKVTQVNLGDEVNPEPNFISESLSPSEKKDLISLVREYIDIFAWNSRICG